MTAAVDTLRGGRRVLGASGAAENREGGGSSGPVDPFGVELAGRGGGLRRDAMVAAGTPRGMLVRVTLGRIP
jgi:hypothetical protein